MKHLILTLLFAFPLFATLTKAQGSKTEWIFIEKEGQKVRKLKQGQNIQIVWRGLSKQITSKGKLRTITADSLALDIKGSTASFAQKDIDEIRVKRKLTLLRGILGVGLILTSLVVTGWVIALFIVFGTEPYDTGESTVGEGLKTMLPFLILGFLGVLLILPHKKTIHQPFGKNWWVQETPAKPNNMP